MSARKFFDPARVQRIAPRDGAATESGQDGRTYVYYDPDVVLAVNVALATNRPLLLSGPSGCGKSSLARNVAASLGRRYYEQVITARTEGRDLLYRFDAVRRLNDAQSSRAAELPPLVRYVEPGALWWALSPETAVNRGSATALPPEHRAHDPSAIAAEDAVVLLDEIDKADPDLPNSLLVPLGSFRFKVDPTEAEITAFRSPLIFITNNGERELPTTFVRRCVALSLTTPGEDDLLDIARELVPRDKWNEALFRALAGRLIELATDPAVNASQRSSTAEYLDAVRACHELDVTSESDPDFKTLLEITLTKLQPSSGLP